MARKQKQRNKFRKRLAPILVSFAGTLLVAFFVYLLLVWEFGEQGAEMMVPSLAAVLPGEDSSESEQITKQVYLRNCTLLMEKEELEDIKGKKCRVLTRKYQLMDGRQVSAVTAVPSYYAERFSAAGWQAQLVVGYVIGDLTAVAYSDGSAWALVAREGETVYCIDMPEGETDGSTLYGLGTEAFVSENGLPADEGVD